MSLWIVHCQLMLIQKYFTCPFHSKNLRFYVSLAENFKISTSWETCVRWFWFSFSHFISALLSTVRIKIKIVTIHKLYLNLKWKIFYLRCFVIMILLSIPNVKILFPNISDAKSGTGLGKVVCHPGSNWGPWVSGPVMEESEHRLEINSHPVDQKKWSAATLVCLMSPPSQWEARIFIHVHNLFVWCNHNIYLNYSFSLSQQRPICEPPSHSSMGPVQCASHYIIYEHCTFSTLSILSWHTSLQTIGWENKKQWESSNTTLHNIDIDSQASLWLG